MGRATARARRNHPVLSACTCQKPPAYRITADALKHADPEALRAVLLKIAAGGGIVVAPR